MAIIIYDQLDFLHLDYSIDWQCLFMLKVLIVLLSLGTNWGFEEPDLIVKTQSFGFLEIVTKVCIGDQ